nr:MAG: hypothetical protein [Sanya fiers-like virus 53]
MLAVVQPFSLSIPPWLEELVLSPTGDQGSRPFLVAVHSKPFGWLGIFILHHLGLVFQLSRILSPLVILLTV